VLHVVERVTVREHPVEHDAGERTLPQVRVRGRQVTGLNDLETGGPQLHRDGKPQVLVVLDHHHAHVIET
jgi:hypothetical protein